MPLTFGPTWQHLGCVSQASSPVFQHELSPGDDSQLNAVICCMQSLRLICQACSSAP